MRCVYSFFEFALKADLLWRSVCVCVFVFFPGESIPFLNSLDWIVVFFFHSLPLFRPANVTPFWSIRFHLGVVSQGYNTFCSVKGKNHPFLLYVCELNKIFFFCALLNPAFSFIFVFAHRCCFFIHFFSPQNYFHIDCEWVRERVNEKEKQQMRERSSEGANEEERVLEVDGWCASDYWNVRFPVQCN